MLADAEKKFVFYDTDTSGLSAEFDQIFQFAAVVTDADFNEMESINVRCRRQPHIVPSFGALMTTCIDPFTLDTANMSNYDLACLLTDKFADWSPATFIGYNTIRFDEPFLRHLFYKNLQPIYQTQIGGNGRLDCMKLVDAVLKIDPAILKHELSPKGFPIRKLESLASLNGFDEHDAHDALGDVRATIFIAKLIKSRRPDIWQNYLTNRSKHLAEDLLYANKFCEVMVTSASMKLASIICSTEDNQGVICFDHIFAANTLPSEDNSWLTSFELKKPSPFFRLKLNSAAYIQAINANTAMFKYSNCDLNSTSARMDSFSKQQMLLSELIQAEKNSRTEYPEGEHLEQKIYDGFFSGDDRKLCEAFHTAAPEDKLTLVGELSDSRLRRLAMRLIAENWPSLLPLDKLAAFDKWKTERLHDNGTGGDISSELSRAIDANSKGPNTNENLIQNCVRYYKEIGNNKHGMGVS